MSISSTPGIIGGKEFNNPSGQEIGILLGILGESFRLENISSMSVELETIRRSSQVKEVNSIKKLPISSAALGYVSGGVPAALLESIPPDFWKPDPDDSTTFWDYALLTATTLKKSLQKQYIQKIADIFNFYGDDLSQFTGERSNFVFAALLTKYNKKTVLGRLDKKYISFLLNTLLFDTYYLNTTGKEEQNNFFELWFDIHKSLPELENLDSDIWKYLRTYFGTIGAVEEKYNTIKETLSTISTKQRIEGVLDINGLELPIPTHSELEGVFRDIWGEELPENILTDIGELYRILLLGQDEALKESSSSHYIDPYELSGVFGDKARFDLHQNKIQIEDATKYVPLKFIWAQQSRNFQKRFMKFFSTNSLDPFNDFQKTGACLLIFLHIRDAHYRETPVLLEQIRRLSKLLIAYPVYLSVQTPEYQNDFFRLWFKSQKQDSVINDPDSPIWIYLYNHFPKATLIQKIHSFITEKVAERKMKKLADTNQHPKAKVSSSITFSVLDNKNTTAHFKDGKCLIGGHVFIDPRAKIHVVVWNKGKGKSKRLREPKFYVFDSLNDIEIDFQPGQVLEIAASQEKNPLSKSKYDGAKFSRINVVYPTKDHPKQGERTLVDPGISRKTNGVIPKSDETVRAKDTSPDYELLSILISMEELTLKRIDDTTVGCSLSVTPEFLEENNLSDTITSDQIRYDISGNTPKLISFLGKKDTQGIDQELIMELERQCSVLIAYREVKQEQIQDFQQKGIYRMSVESEIEQLPVLPGVYIRARRFLKSCKKDDVQLKNLHKQSIYIWQLNRSVIVDRVIKDMEGLGYSIGFSLGKGVHQSIRISKNSGGNAAIFDLDSSEDVDTMQCTSRVGKREESIARYILENTIARLVYDYYNNEKYAGTRNTITKEVTERDGILATTKKRLDDKKGVLVEELVKVETKVGWDNPKIKQHLILGRAGFIRVGGSARDKKRNENYKTATAELFDGLDNYIILDLYARLLKNNFDNERARELVREYDGLIPSVASMSDKRATCEELLSHFNEASIPVQLIDPIHFLYRELMEEETKEVAS